VSNRLGSSNTVLLKQFLAGSQHALVFTGNYLDILTQDITNCATSIDEAFIVTVVMPDKSSTTIEQIRSLKHGLSLKQGENKRLVIIAKAHTMTIEAQNSFLKLLEEPTKNVVFMLLTDRAGGLLPTIISRCTTLPCRKMTLKEANEVYDPATAEFDKLFVISGGEPGKLAMLTQDEGSYSAAIETAKKIVAAKAFNRLTMIEQLLKDKIQVTELLYAMDDVFRAVSRSSTRTSDSLTQLAKKRRIVHEAIKAVSNNCNNKLVLSDVFIRI
jgi:DNA polymerase III delta prime subunit